MQIVILGMHRSGTSATARFINLMGAYFGPQSLALPPGPDNPRGFWERRDVMRMNDQLLHTQQCRWDVIPGWSPELAQPLPAMQTLIAEMDAHPPWFIKDPRLCLTLPAWLPLLRTPIAVIVYRDPLEIAASLHARNRMPPSYAMALWEHYTANLLNASRHLPRAYVRHHDLMANPVATCETLLRQLESLGVRGLSQPDTTAINEFIDPTLYRSRAAPTPLLPHHALLTELLQNTQPLPAELTISEASRRTVAGTR